MMQCIRYKQDTWSYNFRIRVSFRDFIRYQKSGISGGFYEFSVEVNELRVEVAVDFVLNSLRFERCG